MQHKQYFTKMQRKFAGTRRRWNKHEHARRAPLDRFRLSGLVFDLCLAGASFETASAEIKSAASSPAEAAEGIRRFKVSGGVH